MIAQIKNKLILCHIKDIVLVRYCFFLINHHSNQFFCIVKSKVSIQFNSIDDGEYMKSFYLIKQTYIALFLPA